MLEKFGANVLKAREKKKQRNLGPHLNMKHYLNFPLKVGFTTLSQSGPSCAKVAFVDISLVFA